MSKKTLIIIIIAVVAVIGIGTAAYAVTTGVFDPYEQQVRLGYKYLSEMKYEEAVVAFDTAISIEAKRDTAYIGKADAYLAEGGGDAVAKIDESLKAGYGLTQSVKIVDAYSTVADKFYSDGNMDFVAQILEFGYKATSSERIVDAYVRIADALSANDKDEAALDLLRKGFDVTGNDKLKDMIAGIIDKISSAFMKNLYGLFEAGNIDEVKDIMRTDEFNTVASYATETEPEFYSPTSASTAKSGKGVGIYYGRFVYYGDYADNVRSGQGMWLHYFSSGNSTQEYTFEGQWADDKPNGNGKEESKWLSSMEDSYHSVYEVSQGTYENGLENGTITRDANYEEQGGRHHHYIWQYTATAGVAPRLSGEKNLPDGAYTIARSTADAGGFAQHEGDRLGVFGFAISADQE